MSKEKITINQVEEAILTGEIILERPGGKPYPKCLISGYAKKRFMGEKINQPIYVVCALGQNIEILTVHRNIPTKWIRKRR